MSKTLVIGVLGGMGTYATIHMFRQYAEIFEAEKEWDRPRIVIDNRCTMPSRVRAFLYHENVEQLVEEMSESIQELIHAGCNKIILACNTSHLFLPQIFQKVPEYENSVVHIITNCADQIQKDGVSNVYLLGSEGTIESKVYQEALKPYGVTCEVPVPEEYAILRDCIEAVKQNKNLESVKEQFLQLVNRSEHCILGCTELPVLYEQFKNDVTCKKVYDPVKISLQKLKEEL